MGGFFVLFVCFFFVGCLVVAMLFLLFLLWLW